MMDKEWKVSILQNSSTKSILETNIMKQVLETTILVTIGDLLETLPQLRVEITHGNIENGKNTKEEPLKEEEKMGKVITLHSPLEWEEL